LNTSIRQIAIERPQGQPLSSRCVWTIDSYRDGENTQIKGLAERLGWAWERKKLAYGPLAGLLGLARRVSILGIRRAASDELQAPWPDLVISAGLKNEPVCRWIREQSGGKTRIIFLGRVWANYEHFDLIITTPQYRLPLLPNILHQTTTQHGVVDEKLRQAAREWVPRFRSLPGPRIGVLVGGNSGPYVLGEKASRRLALQLNRQCAGGGSALITTSRRTGAEVGEVLRKHLACPYYLFDKNRDEAPNPYLGILALADRFIVTGDSVAMLSEAAATGKPVQIFHLPVDGSEDVSLKSLAYRLLMRFGPQRLSRDIGIFHHHFTDGQAVCNPDQTLRRVRHLFAKEPSADPVYLDLSRIQTR